MAANAENTRRLFITHVNAIGHYLKICGQLNPDAMTLVRQKMHKILPTCMAIDPTWQLDRHQAFIKPGQICLFKSVNGAAPADFEFMRVRIIKIVDVVNSGSSQHLRVEVDFIDYGYKREVHSYELLVPQKPELLQTIPVLCTEYILLGICANWDLQKLNEIENTIKNQYVEITILYELYQHKFIVMKWKEFEFAEYLILHKIIGGGPITDELLLDYFKKNETKIKILTNGTTTTTTGTTNFTTNGTINTMTLNNNNTNNNNNYNYVNANLHKNQTNKGFQINAQSFVPYRRSLADRLQVRPMLVKVPLQEIGPPRMPQSIGNLRNMMQGMNYQNAPHIVTPGLNNFYQQPMVYMASMSPYISSASAPAQRFRPINMPRLQAHNGSIAKTNLNNRKSPERRLSPATFKSNHLVVGETYDVLVSFVENGPYLFSVQLVSMQNELCEMMTAIESVEKELKRLTDKPMLGTACIARYSEDNQLYRALITNVQAHACKVAYIDYGNAELVSYNNLFEIPHKFLDAQAYAIRFSLTGIKSIEPIDDSLKKTFSESVTFKHCKLKVMPLEGPPVVQYCELYNEGQNMLNVLKSVQSKRSVYPKAENLRDNDIVEIRYIDSPKCFFVQKVSNIQKFHQLMDEMFTYYNKNQVVPSQLQLGAPCIVKCENDWYRGEIIRDDDTAIIVRHVDFGYEQKVTRNLIGAIAPQHLKMPRQAVQCCLKGFENNELDKDLAITQFEMLAEDSNLQRRLFSVKVFRIEPNGINLVNLFTKELNVMKKLYKLSMPFEEYVNLEKIDFNMSKTLKKPQSEAGGKTPSIASEDNSLASIKSSQKVNIINSTTLLSDERMQQQQQQKLKGQQQVQQKVNSPSKQLHQQSPQSGNNKENLISPNNLFNRDARSTTSSEGRNQNKNHKQQNGKKQSVNNWIDAQSTTSSVSQRSNNSTRSGSQRSSPRQRNKNEQQQYARPQNAPQGYAQSPRSNPNSPRHQDKNMPKAVVPVANGNDAASHKTIEYVPLDHAFVAESVKIPSCEDVVLCWWISPHQFYTQLKSRMSAYEHLMQEMQQFYKDKPTQQLQLKIGYSVIARHRKDNMVYRARILACNQMLRKYKVFFVDTGYHLTVTSEDIWKVEKRFAKFPCMAYQCTFSGIIANYDHLYIIDRMDKYFPDGACIKCEYTQRNNDVYCVNLTVNRKCLKQTLIGAKLITAVDPELNVDLLAGQQIRAKISNIRDMLNFKIQIETCTDDIKFLSAYDDVRFVKSNSDLTKKFKEFYEGMSCVVNIKNVNDDKVIQLRPLMPLFKTDIATNICTYPIVYKKFEASVVFIESAYRIYCQALSAETEISALLNDMYDHYVANAGEPLKKLERDQICAANGSDENWYRARIKSAPQKPTDLIEVYYIDYGNTERLQRTKIKQLHEKFYLNKSAYAIAVNLPIRTSTDLLHKGKKSQELNTETDIKVIQELGNITFEKTMLVDALEVRHNHLIADLIIAENQMSVIDLLQQKKFIKTRDVDYIRKVLDKEHPNVLEYIEMVDLTLEDEDDMHDRKTQNKNKSNSPKKPKQKENQKKSEDTETIKKEEPKDNVANESAEIVQEPVQTAPSAVTPPPPIEEVAKIAEVTTTPVPAEPEVDPYADMEHAVLSHCDNPAQFFVHLQDRVDELYKLQENLQIVAALLPPLMSVVNGANCISLYSVDKQWYRAKILDAELMVLKFIDFGNTDCVSDPTEVKEMSVFPDIEPFCVPCALPIRPNGTADWVDAANAIFNDSYNKILHFEHITHGDLEKRSFINLFIDGVNIAEKLIADGFAKPLEVVESGENCFISHVNSITDFYIQYEKNSKALELMECYLSDANNLKQLEHFERGKIVAALFPDDSMWYRAKLLKQLPNEGGYEVLFIDYGNTSISPECREITEEIAKLPTLSKKCALELPAVCVAWSEASEEKFAEFAALGETIFTVELREPAVDHAVVHLFIDGQNINDELQPLCEQKLVELLPDLNASICNTTMATSIYEAGSLYEATVSHSNSPGDFYVQFNKDSERLADMTTSINALGMDALKQPEVGQVCAALFADDGLLYRARILEVLGADLGCRVLFIDYGNVEVSKDLRILPQDLQQVKAFAKHCQLENSAKFNVMGENATAIFDALLDECEFIVKVDMLTSEPEPAMVKLFAAKTDENVCEKMNVLLGIDAHSVDNKHCLISHASSPHLFYVQLKSNSHKMEFIKKLLNKGKASEFPIMSMPKLDDVCSVYADEDDCYYRARVLSITNDHCEVFLLDQGSTLNVKELRTLPKVLLGIPALAVKCQLNAIPAEVDEKVLEERFLELIDSHFGEIYEIRDEKLDGDEHIVQLQVNYKDLAEELAKAVDNEQVSKPIMPELHDCSIVFNSTPQSFYIQLTEDFDALEQIRVQLLDAEEKYAKLENIEVGALCAALFPEDNIYYRAKIIEIIDNDKYEVHYIDFGNNSITENIRQLPEALLELPAYAKHCSIGNEANVCSPAFSFQFQDYIDAKFSETFRVEFLATKADPQICRLFYQDIDVAKDIIDIIKSANEAQLCGEQAAEQGLVDADDDAATAAADDVIDPSESTTVEAGGDSNNDIVSVLPSSGISSMEELEQ